jgi:hypothetical protein
MAGGDSENHQGGRSDQNFYLLFCCCSSSSPSRRKIAANLPGVPGRFLRFFAVAAALLLPPSSPLAAAMEAKPEASPEFAEDMEFYVLSLA